MPEFDFLNRAKIDYWWKMVTVAGLAIVLASIAIKFVPTILMGFGVFLAGIAEWQRRAEWNFPTPGSLTRPPGIGTRITKEARGPGTIVAEIIAALLVLGGFIKLFLA